MAALEVWPSAHASRRTGMAGGAHECTSLEWNNRSSFQRVLLCKDFFQQISFWQKFPRFPGNGTDSTRPDSNQLSLARMTAKKIPNNWQPQTILWKFSYLVGLAVSRDHEWWWCSPFDPWVLLLLALGIKTRSRCHKQSIYTEILHSDWLMQITWLV